MNIRDYIIVSDTHSGCGMALCPPQFDLVDKGSYVASPIQKQIWQYWTTDIKEWIPYITQGRPYGVIHNGDAMDYVHHRSVSQISHNILDHHLIFKIVMDPLLDKAKEFYMLRGTEAHSGPSSKEEELLARYMGAIARDNQYARYELDLEIEGFLVNFMHHIGVSNRNNSELTAIAAELHEIRQERLKWKKPVPH